MKNTDFGLLMQDNGSFVVCGLAGADGAKVVATLRSGATQIVRLGDAVAQDKYGITSYEIAECGEIMYPAGRGC